MKNKKIVIIGSGVSALGSFLALNQLGYSPVLFEQSSVAGGLCGFFEVNGFKFDKFVHFSFSKLDEFKKLISDKTKYISHNPNMYNFYHNLWLKHPVQNNLKNLPLGEKFKIIFDFLIRNRDENNIKTYQDWLFSKYGRYFTEKFPNIYTKKYWGTDSANLETKWIGNRMYSPSFWQIIKGALFNVKENFYYAQKMNYPCEGTYLKFFEPVIEAADIKFNKKVVEINSNNKTIKFQDNTVESYDWLISSMPLPEIISSLVASPPPIKRAIEKLRWTKGYMVSIGFNKIINTKGLWNYIYDEEILASRIYFPHLKTPKNVPSGKSSLQAEIYFSNKSKLDKTEREILDNTVEAVIKTGICNREDIEFSDIRFEEYANIIFNSDIYEARKVIIDYLNSIGIRTIGRFGKWDYLWSDQAFMDGYKEIGEIYDTIK